MSPDAVFRRSSTWFWDANCLLSQNIWAVTGKLNPSAMFRTLGRDRHYAGGLRLGSLLIFRRVVAFSTNFNHPTKHLIICYPTEDHCISTRSHPTEIQMSILCDWLGSLQWDEDGKCIQYCRRLPCSQFKILSSSCSGFPTWLKDKV